MHNLSSSSFFVGFLCCNKKLLLFFFFNVVVVVVVVFFFFFCFFVVPIGLMTTPPIMSSSGSIHSHRPQENSSSYLCSRAQPRPRLDDDELELAATGDFRSNTCQILALNSRYTKILGSQTAAWLFLAEQPCKRKATWLNDLWEINLKTMEFREVHNENSPVASICIPNADEKFSCYVIWWKRRWFAVPGGA